MIMARTSGKAGDGGGITAFLVPTDSPGLRGRRVPVDVQHADRPRPHPAHRRAGAAHARSSAARAGACRWCSTSSTRTASARPPRASAPRSTASTSRSKYAKERKPFGKPLATNQAHPVPAGRAADPVRDAARADPQDRLADGHVRRLQPVATRCRCATTGPTGCAARPPTGPCRCTAAWATRRHKPFEHIYRHHRRYRITEGAEEIQMRRVAGYMFGFMNQRAPKGVTED